MTGPAPPFRAWLELLRVSNLPTVASNVLVGAALAGLGGAAISPGRSLLVLAAGALSYVGGMALNDAFDAEHDRTARTRRPIPSGRISRAAAFRVGFGAVVGSVLVLVPLGAGTVLAGAALAGMIVVYDAVHHRAPAWLASVLMGTCRSLLVLVAWLAVATTGDVGAVPRLPFAVVAGAIGAYTAVVTWLARGEESIDARPRAPIVAHALPVLGLLPVTVAAQPVLPLAFAAGAGLIAWHARTVRYLGPRPPVAIMGWLAGLALVDTCALALLGEPTFAIGAAACFVVTVLGHRRILGS